MVFLIDGLAFHGLAAAAAADRERKVGVQRGAVHVAIVAFVVVASALPRAAAGEDWIYYGFGDAGKPNNLKGPESETTDPDAYVAPEPAGLLLLALAGLGLRRR